MKYIFAAVFVLGIVLMFLPSIVSFGQFLGHKLTTMWNKQDEALGSPDDLPPWEVGSDKKVPDYDVPPPIDKDPF